MWINLFSKTQYDWVSILKRKSNEELGDFIKRALVDIEAKVAAIDELKRRKIDPKRIEELSLSILKDLKFKKKELLQVTLADKLNKYMVYAQLTALPIFIYFAFHIVQGFSLINQFLIFTGIIALVVLNIFKQQKDIRKKKMKKEIEINEIESHIKKYKEILKI